MDLRFCETLSLKSFPDPQSCSIEETKSTVTGAIYICTVMQSEKKLSKLIVETLTGN